MSTMASQWLIRCLPHGRGCHLPLHACTTLRSPPPPRDGPARCHVPYATATTGLFAATPTARTFHPPPLGRHARHTPPHTATFGPHYPRRHYRTPLHARCHRHTPPFSRGYRHAPPHVRLAPGYSRNAHGRHYTPYGLSCCMFSVRSLVTTVLSAFVAGSSVLYGLS